MRRIPCLPAVAAAAALLTATACADRRHDTARDGAPGNPPSTATQRAYDRVTDSGPTPPDGTPGNPSGTAVQRAFDRAAGTNTSGAFPSQSDGTRANPPGTAVSRAYDQMTGSNTSGAYPQNSGGMRQR